MVQYCWLEAGDLSGSGLLIFANSVILQASFAECLVLHLQVAVAFAEMHDTPVRMVAKGVLHGIVPWAQARLFLATRLRRRCDPVFITCSPEVRRGEINTYLLRMILLGDEIVALQLICDRKLFAWRAPCTLC